VEADKRIHQRFCPQGLKAHIIIDPPPPDAEIVIDGCVVDISYSGIKIKLKRPLEQQVDNAELRISIVLPESGVVMRIHGMIKHIQEQQQCGLQYSDQHTEDELDNLMFECIKFVEQPDLA
jgi:hypothetical protein